MPFTILAPVIFVLCVIGGYAPTQSMHDVWLMLVFGVVGYLMRKLDYPMAPAVLAIVLGPLAETSMRQSLLISDGSFLIFFTRPISGPIMLVAIALFLLPLIQRFREVGGRREKGKAISQTARTYVLTFYFEILIDGCLFGIQYTRYGTY